MFHAFKNSLLYILFLKFSFPFRNSPFCMIQRNFIKFTPMMHYSDIHRMTERILKKFTLMIHSCIHRAVWRKEIWTNYHSNDPFWNAPCCMTDINLNKFTPVIHSDIHRIVLHIEFTPMIHSDIHLIVLHK